MKITLAEVKSLESSLSKIFNKDVNIKLAYRLGKLLKRLSEEMKMLEENRIKLVKKYGEEDEETKQLSVPPEKTQEFYNEFNELMQIEIETLQLFDKGQRLPVRDQPVRYLALKTLTLPRDV